MWCVCAVQGHLYAGSDYGAAQMPLATCERSRSCMDCVLARDPYCGWDQSAGRCTLLAGSERYCRPLSQHVEQASIIQTSTIVISHFSELIQSVKDGDATLCPEAGEISNDDIKSD